MIREQILYDLKPLDHETFASCFVSLDMFQWL